MLIGNKNPNYKEKQPLKKSRSRSKSPPKSRESYKSKSSYSRSRSKSKSKTSKSKRSLSRQKHHHSRSRSKSVSPYSNGRRRSSKVSRSALSKSRSPLQRKSHKRSRTRSKSPLKKETKDPLDAWRMAKLASLKKNSQASISNHSGSDKVAVLLAGEVSIESIPLPVPASDDQEPKIVNPSVIPLPTVTTDNESPKKIDLQTIPIPCTEENNFIFNSNKLEEANDLNNSSHKNLENTKTPEKNKDEGKGKVIVIKSLKDSRVFQQAEEEAQKKAQTGDDDDDDDDDDNNYDDDYYETSYEVNELKEEEELSDCEEAMNSCSLQFQTEELSELSKMTSLDDVKIDEFKSAINRATEDLEGMEEGEILSIDEPVRAKKKESKKSKNKSSKKNKEDKEHKSEKKDKGEKNLNKKESRSKEKKKSEKKSRRSRSRSKSKRKSRSKSRSRRKSRSPSRSRFKSRSRSRSKIKSKSRSRSRRRSRSRSKSRWKNSRSRSRSRSFSRNKGHKKSRSRSKSHSRHRKPSHRNERSSSSRDRFRRSPDCVDSLRDKATRKRLLEVARKNAVYLLNNNCLPPSVEKESIKATGKSVEELTNFCQQLVAKNYSDTELSDPSLSPDESDSQFEKSFGGGRHPFALKDSKPILMNIRNAPMLPIKTNAERLADTSKLREQFPVSSGSQHRTKESGWVVVEKNVKIKEDVTVFPDEKRLNDVDISMLVSTRLNAMRRLQDNPQDKEAIHALTSAQREMQDWALSKQKPGQFTGSTGARILSQEELSSGYQAWARKEQFKEANPVRSHFGLKMLQKMGWNPGEGLGKNKEGQLEPLQLDVKMDKKGLTAQMEMCPRRTPIPLARSLAGKCKHPVSALVEICSKRRWPPPEFEIVFDCGPDHKKNFLMKVHVNNQVYKPAIAASTKKIAKANAAAACLQALGLIPKSIPLKPQGTLKTIPQSTSSTEANNTAAEPSTEAKAIPVPDEPSSITSTTIQSNSGIFPPPPPPPPPLPPPMMYTEPSQPRPGTVSKVDFMLSSSETISNHGLNENHNQAENVQTVYQSQTQTQNLQSGYQNQAEIIQTSYQNQSESIPAEYQNQAENIQSTYQSQSEHIQSVYQNQPDHIQGVYQNQAENIQAVYQNQAENIQAGYPATEPGQALSAAQSVAYPSNMGYYDSSNMYAANPTAEHVQYYNSPYPGNPF